MLGITIICTARFTLSGIAGAVVRSCNKTKQKQNTLYDIGPLVTLVNRKEGRGTLLLYLVSRFIPGVGSKCKYSQTYFICILSA